MRKTIVFISEPCRRIIRFYIHIAGGNTNLKSSSFLKFTQLIFSFFTVFDMLTQPFLCTVYFYRSMLCVRNFIEILLNVSQNDMNLNGMYVIMNLINMLCFATLLIFKFIIWYARKICFIPRFKWDVAGSRCFVLW